MQAVIDFSSVAPVTTASVELEEAILGSILFDPGILEAEVVRTLPTTAFSIRPHRLIFGEMLELHKAGLKPDTLTLSLRLTQSGHLEEIGGRAKLAQLLDRQAVHSVMAVQHAQDLKDLYQRHYLSDSLNRVAQQVGNDGDINSVINQAKEQLERFEQQVNGLPTPSLRDRVRTALSDCHSASDIQSAILKLSKETGYSSRDLWQLADSIQTEQEWEDDRDVRKIDLTYLTGLEHKRLDLFRVLHPNLANPLIKVAEWMGVDPEALLTVLIPTAASLLHPESRVVVHENTDFVEPLIFFTGIVSESGNRKSPILKLASKSLWKLQQEEEERYREAYEEWVIEYNEWQQDKSRDKGEAPPKPNPPREYYVETLTIEALLQIISQQPSHGLVWSADELSSVMGSYGQYKGGRGTDLETVLSLWTGKPIKKNLAGGTRISIPQSAVSITGSIQPDKLKQQMGDLNDSQGQWGRFLWYNFPLTPYELPDNDAKIDVFDLLIGLYRWLDQLPPQRLTLGSTKSDTYRLFKAYHKKLDQRRCSEPRQGVRAALAKMQGYAARLCGILYLMWCRFAGVVPETQIPKEWVEAGIVLTEFYIGQQALLYSDGEADQGELTPILARILQKAQQLGQLSTRIAKQAIKALRDFKAPKILDLFHELAAIGLGVVNGKVFIPNGGNGTTPPTPPMGVAQKVDRVDPMLTEMLTRESSAISIDIALSQAYSDENVDHVNHVDHFSEPNPQEMIDQVIQLAAVDNESLNNGQQSQQVNILDEAFTQSEIECVDQESAVGSTILPDQEQAIAPNLEPVLAVSEPSQTVSDNPSTIPDPEPEPDLTVSSESLEVDAPTEAIAPDQPQQPAPKIGDAVSSPDGQRGIVGMIYPDGQLGVEFENDRFSMWKPSQVVVVNELQTPGSKSTTGGEQESASAIAPNQKEDATRRVEEQEVAPAPTQNRALTEFKVGQSVCSKKGFYCGVVAGYAKDGRIIVERRARKGQKETKLFAMTELQPVTVNG